MTPGTRTDTRPCLSESPARRRGLGHIVLTMVLGLALPAAAHAQSQVYASATPSPFTSGATITVTASVDAGTDPETHSSWAGGID